MEWIRIKIQHGLFEYPEFNKNPGLMGAWVKAMALTAQMEKLPTDNQLRSHIHATRLKTLRKMLKNHGTSLENVLKKVMEDVEYVQHLRAKGRSKMAEWREKRKNVTNEVTDNVTGNVTEVLPSIDKIRLDKIRLDKNNTVAATPHTPQAEFIESWKGVYKAKTGHEYKTTTKDFVLVAGLLKRFSFDEVVAKSKLLGEFCDRRSAWFTKGGMADFTIGKLSGRWNELIEGGDNNGGKKFGISKGEYEELAKKAT